MTEFVTEVRIVKEELAVLPHLSLFKSQILELEQSQHTSHRGEVSIRVVCANKGKKRIYNLFWN